MNLVDKKQLIAYCQKAKKPGFRPKKVIMHWTAGNYTNVFNDYHACIKGDGELYFTTDNMAEVLEHTWRRNTGNIGLALCCAAGAVFPDKFPKGFEPTVAQIETLAETMAILAKEFNLSITKDVFMTHTEIAIIDGYGPYSGDSETKWDLFLLKDSDGYYKPGGEVLRGKANWYLKNS
ncbi:MAG: N-acetylmuramoyl-L-alanine amidase [Sporomusaceae bacterium]|jgi:hypothetical protein|nr:N-acetylmuramoyl-L-alanine amidase [Sporomusaceae bacterium]